MLNHEKLSEDVGDHYAGLVQQWRAPRGAPIHQPPVVRGHAAAPRLLHVGGVWGRVPEGQRALRPHQERTAPTSEQMVDVELGGS